MELELITKQTKTGERFAVRYIVKGAVMQTLFTSFRDEAIAWGRIIRETGYCMSARPMKTA